MDLLWLLLCLLLHSHTQVLLASVKAPSTSITQVFPLPHALWSPCRLPDTALQVLSNMTWVCATSGFHHDTAFIQAAAAAVTNCAGSLRGQVALLLQPACICLCLCNPFAHHFGVKVSGRQTDRAV